MTLGTDISEQNRKQNMQQNHEYWMARAIELSIENVKKNNGGPFGAVIVKDNKLIAEGTNLVTASNDPTAHAEIVAIRRACTALGNFQLTDAILYTSCEPCPMCLGAIYWARPKEVYFANTKADAAIIGFDDSFIYEQIDLPFDQRSIPMHQLMQTEAQNAFKIWQETINKIAY